MTSPIGNRASPSAPATAPATGGVGDDGQFVIRLDSVRPAPVPAQWVQIIGRHEWVAGQHHRLAHIARPTGIEALVRAVTKLGAHDLRQAHRMARMADWPLIAARESAAIIRSSKAAPEDIVAAWLHLLEFGQGIGIKVGTPYEIVQSTRAWYLDRIPPFTTAEMIECMVGELLSSRLDNLEWVTPTTALRKNVMIERKRHYTNGLRLLRETDAVEKPLPDPSGEDSDQIPSLEAISHWEQEVVVVTDLELVLAELRHLGLPDDAAALLQQRFRIVTYGEKGLDTDVRRAEGWDARRLEAAQAHLRPERWGGTVCEAFRNAGYLPPACRPRKPHTGQPEQEEHRPRGWDTLRWPQFAARARTGRFGGHRVIFLSANSPARIPLNK